MTIQSIIIRELKHRSPAPDAIDPGDDLQLCALERQGIRQNIEGQMHDLPEFCADRWVTMGDVLRSVGVGA